MFKNVSQLEVPMHNVVLDESLKCIENLHQVFYYFFFRYSLLGLKVILQVTFITIFEYQVDVVLCFFDVVQFDNVVVVALFEYFDFVFE